MRAQTLIAGLVLCAIAIGCDGGKENVIAQGRAALLKRDLDTAMAKFEEALKDAPQDYNGMWGRSQVLGLRGDFKAQKDQLLAIMAVPEFAERAAPREELDKVYQKLAEQAESQAGIENNLRKAIETNPRSEAHAKLADVLVKKGDLATRNGDHDAAAKAYGEVPSLRVAKKLKRMAKAKSELAGYMAFRTAFKKEFGEKYKAELVELGQYDAKESTFIVEASVELELKPTDEGFAALAHGQAQAGARVALEDFAFKFAGMERPDGVKLTFSKSDVQEVGEPVYDKKSKTFTKKYAVNEDVIFEHVRAIRKDPPKAVPQPAAGEAPAGELQAPTEGE